MPVRATILVAHKLVYSRYVGIIERQDIVTALMDVYESDAYLAGMNELVDLRRVTEVKIDYDEMSQHVQHANLTHQRLNKPIVVSFLAQKNVAFGMARMFQTLSEALNSNMVCHVSSDRQTALSVLGLPASALENVLEV